MWVDARSKAPSGAGGIVDGSCVIATSVITPGPYVGLASRRLDECDPVALGPEPSGG